MLNSVQKITKFALFLAALAYPINMSFGGAKDGGATDEAIEKLIDRLSPKTVPPGDANDPDVFAASDELLKLGTKAFPKLIDHFDDRRFSFHEEGMADGRNYEEPVGSHCYRLVARQINKWQNWKMSDPRNCPTYGHSMIFSGGKGAHDWWEKNKTKSLWELQADSIRWAIETDKDPEVVKRYGLSYTITERRKLATDAIAANEARLKQLTDSKKPLPCSPFRPYRGK